MCYMKNNKVRGGTKMELKNMLIKTKDAVVLEVTTVACMGLGIVSSGILKELHTVCRDELVKVREEKREIKRNQKEAKEILDGMNYDWSKRR